MIKEFIQFIKKNNVGVIVCSIIGSIAFLKIVSSFVCNVFMPLLGICLGGIDFNGLSINVGNASINYGLFLQDIIELVLIVVGLYFIIKFLNKINEKK